MPRTGSSPKPDGVITRGTTAPNRLRRIDRWIAYALGSRLRGADRSVVVDLGFGRSPVTTREWFDRLRGDFGNHIDVVGVEVDRSRVRDAEPFERDGLTFRHGGFELSMPSTDRPRIVRALNVLRQYDESEVEAAWSLVVSGLTDDGVFVEGTCDELGRVCSWVALYAEDLSVTGVARPRTLTFATRLSSLSTPSDLAPRLPKALIHRNVPGEAIHAFFVSWDRAWELAAPAKTFGVRQRWIQAACILRDGGAALVGPSSRWRLGELSVEWSAVAPTE